MIYPYRGRYIEIVAVQDDGLAMGSFGLCGTPRSLLAHAGRYIPGLGAGDRRAGDALRRTGAVVWAAHHELRGTGRAERALSRPMEGPYDGCVMLKFLRKWARKFVNLFQ